MHASVRCRCLHIIIISTGDAAGDAVGAVDTTAQGGSRNRPSLNSSRLNCEAFLSGFLDSGKTISVAVGVEVVLVLGKLKY